MVIVRDQLCRTPWCGAPIRRSDHAVRAADGGGTALDNGQGLCESCNYINESPGWSTTPGPGGAGESVTITTPPDAPTPADHPHSPVSTVSTRDTLTSPSLDHPTGW